MILSTKEFTQLSHQKEYKFLIDPIWRRGYLVDFRSLREACTYGIFTGGGRDFAINNRNVIKRRARRAEFIYPLAPIVSTAIF